MLRACLLVSSCLVLSCLVCLRRRERECGRGRGLCRMHANISRCRFFKLLGVLKGQPGSRPPGEPSGGTTTTSVAVVLAVLLRSFYVLLSYVCLYSSGFFAYPLSLSFFSIPAHPLSSLCSCIHSVVINSIQKFLMFRFSCLFF